MRKLIIVLVILLSVELTFAKVNFEFRNYEKVIDLLMNLFNSVDLNEKSPIIRNLQLLLGQDPLTYFGSFTGLFDLETRTAISNLQSAFGFPPHGFLNRETVRNLFPNCQIEITAPASGEVILGEPTMISWHFQCLPFLGKFTIAQFVANYRILRLMSVNVYLTSNCPDSNIWWYPARFPDCSYRLLAKLPLLNQSFIWTPEGIATGTYTIRLLPTNWQIFQRDLGLIPSSWAKLFAESERFRIVLPKGESSSPAPSGEIELPSM